LRILTAQRGRQGGGNRQGGRIMVSGKMSREQVFECPMRRLHTMKHSPRIVAS
jgi:hypothetical protein